MRTMRHRIGYGLCFLFGACCGLLLRPSDASAQPSELPEPEAPAPAKREAPPTPATQEWPNAAKDERLSAPAPDASAEAGDMDIDELAGMGLEELLSVEVVTATKTKTKATVAPAIIAVITKQDIERWGYQSVAEVLQHVVGFYVVDDHVLPNAGVRGMAGGLFGESGTIKVMIDGHSVAFRSTGGNWLGPELVSLSAVERIEIVRGPSSALYGADAFLGVVNIITRRGGSLSGADLRAGAEGSAQRDPGTDLDLAAGARSGDLELFVAMRAHRESRSGLELPDSSPAPRVPEYRLNDLTTRGADHSSEVALARATYHLRESSTLSLVAHHATFDRGSELSPWTHLPYGLDEGGRLHETRISLRQTSVGLVHEAAFGDTAGLTMRGYYVSGRPTSNDRIDIGSEFCAIRRDFGYQGLEGQIEGHFELTEGLGAVLGTEVNVDREQLPSGQQVLMVSTGSSRAGDTIQLGETNDAQELLWNVGAFAQAFFSQLEPHLSVVGGARYDQHSIYGGQFSARVGAVSNPYEPVVVKLLYGSAFLAPSPLLLYGVPYRVGDVVGNPSLEPQRVHTVEGQVSVYPLKVLALSTGLAYSQLFDKAEFVQQGLNRVAQNLSEVSSLSWESEAVLKHEQWVHGYASFELPLTTRELGQVGYQADLMGDKNVIYPKFIVRSGLSGVVPGIPLRPALEFSVVGPRRASEMNILEAGSEYTLPAYSMLDASLATVGLEILDGRQTVLMIKGRNLLDVGGPDPGFAGVDYPLLPRSVLAQVRQQF